MTEALKQPLARRCLGLRYARILDPETPNSGSGHFQFDCSTWAAPEYQDAKGRQYLTDSRAEPPTFTLETPTALETSGHHSLEKCTCKTKYSILPNCLKEAKYLGSRRAKGARQLDQMQRSAKVVVNAPKPAVDPYQKTRPS